MSFIQQLINLLAPRRCLNCQRTGSYFCQTCINQQLDFKPIQKCPLCNQPSSIGSTHARCQTPHSIDGIYSLTAKNQLITKYIKLLKYRQAFDLINSLPEITSHHQPQWLTQFDYLIPIPLHPERLHWRGFNQSQLIAESLSQQLNLPVKSHLLVKTHPTIPQAELKNRANRLQNTKNTFKSPSKFRTQISNHSILLIDDVTTTGATLNHAAQPLKRAGARSVWGLVLTR